MGRSGPLKGCTFCPMARYLQCLVLFIMFSVNYGGQQMVCFKVPPSFSPSPLSAGKKP